jgi:hypothetical protein
MEPNDDKRARGEEPAPFARQADAKQAGFFTEFWLFLRGNKKWWLTPIIVVVVFLGVLVILGGTGAAPFIYTLF